MISIKNKIKNLTKLFFRVILRTLYFNFKVLPLKQAIKLPIFLSRKVYLRKISGKIVLEGDVYPGMVRIGFNDVGIFDNKVSRTILTIFGTLIFKGEADIGHGSKLSVGGNGVLVLGENFKISAESSIIADASI